MRTRLVLAMVAMAAWLVAAPVGAWRTDDQAVSAGRPVQFWSLGYGGVALPGDPLALIETHDTADWQGWRVAYVGQGDDLVSAIWDAREKARAAGWDTARIEFYKPEGGTDRVVDARDRTHDVSPPLVMRMALYLR